MVRIIAGLLFYALYAVLFMQPAAAAEKDAPLAAELALAALKDELISYFEPVSGSVTGMTDNSLKIDKGTKSRVKPGMRFFVYKEGVKFVHPVTKEALGRMEMPVGNIEIVSAGENSSEGTIVQGKREDFEKAKIKIPAKKVKLLFYQGKVDWYLGDAYYQLLKDSGRFELLDTGLETEDMSKLAAEARERGAEILLALDSTESAGLVKLTQKFFWAGDAKQFGGNATSINSGHVKELRFKSGLYAEQEGAVLLSIELSSRSRHMALGDVDGDGIQDLLLSSGDEIEVYRYGLDLKLLWTLKAAPRSEILWIDTIDSGKGPRSKILVTAMSEGLITSYVYEFDPSKPAQVKGGVAGGLVLLAKIKGMFLRGYEGSILGQEFDKNSGYDGDVFKIVFKDGAYKKGEKFKLPPAVNIYDFQFIRAIGGEKGVLAWDEEGHLNLYNEAGVSVWRSKEDYGGFSLSYKKETPTIMVDKGMWAIKDRLLNNYGEILAPFRTPLVGMAKGLGYRKSAIKSLLWNGLTVEERTLVDKIGGELYDYVFIDNRLVVLSKSLFGVNMANVLKGRSPLGVTINIYPMKGM
ncbi:MAG: hypothetical protein EPN22_03710 [Nitrospirae bacterium]|nr:MAG: hypothetical protein EPN22_03710 [Nitrospirota bacterium]